MSSRKNPMVLSLIAFSVALVMAFGAVSPAAAADAREIPLLVDLGGGVSVQVVNVHFTDEIPGSRGNHMKVPEDKTEVMWNCRT